MEKQEDKEDKKPVAEALAAKELNIEELKKKLEECEKQKCEYLSCWQRERADFLNYKKEVKDTIDAVVAFEDGAIALKILPILDNFEIIARQNFLPENLDGQEKGRIKKVIDGFLQIKKQLQDFLKSQGVEEIESLGKKFDPQLHEVVEVVEPAQISSKIVAGKEIKSGMIIEEIQKGYKINGRLLRPAKVKISK
jgi:molecular chaperone GrpE